jgi:hypothetical protein
VTKVILRHPKSVGSIIMNNTPAGHDGDTVSNGFGHSEILLNEQYCHTFLRQLAQDARKFSDDHWRQSLAWLIQHQNTRVSDQGSGNGKHLLFAP